MARFPPADPCKIPRRPYTRKAPIQEDQSPFGVGSYKRRFRGADELLRIRTADRAFRSLTGYGQATEGIIAVAARARGARGGSGGASPWRASARPADRTWRSTSPRLRPAWRY